MSDEKDNRSEQRSETARRHDDSELVDASQNPPTPDKVGRSGGNLQRDVATADPEQSLADPDAPDKLTKADEIAHGQRSGGDNS